MTEIMSRIYNYLDTLQYALFRNQYGSIHPNLLYVPIDKKIHKLSMKTAHFNCSDLVTSRLPLTQFSQKLPLTLLLNPHQWVLTKWTADSPLFNRTWEYRQRYLCWFIANNHFSFRRSMSPWLAIRLEEATSMSQAR